MRNLSTRPPVASRGGPWKSVEARLSPSGSAIRVRPCAAARSTDAPFPLGLSIEQQVTYPNPASNFAGRTWARFSGRSPAEDDCSGCVGPCCGSPMWRARECWEQESRRPWSWSLSHIGLVLSGSPATFLVSFNDALSGWNDGATRTRTRGCWKCRSAGHRTTMFSFGFPRGSRSLNQIASQVVSGRHCGRME